MTFKNFNVKQHTKGLNFKITKFNGVQLEKPFNAIVDEFNGEPAVFIKSDKYEQLSLVTGTIDEYAIDFGEDNESEVE